MKWIRFVVPLVLSAVAATADAQQWITPSRYVASTTAGTSRPTSTRTNRLIVAEEPAPVAGVEEGAIVVQDEGVPCDDCGARGHLGCKKWGCGCKAKKHCCAKKSCGGCWSPCGVSLPKITFGCDSCSAPASCDVCGSCAGARPKWLHGCSACRPSWHCYLPKITWSSGCGCASPSMVEGEVIAPQPEPQPAGEPIPAPRRAAPPSAPPSAPPEQVEPSAKSASTSAGWQPRNRTRTATVWDAPQPGVSRPATYEYRVR